MLQNSSLTEVEVYTDGHCYSGLVLNRGYRLADLLNDPASELIEMRNVQVTQPMNESSDPMTFDELLLKKESIYLVFPTGTTYEAPVRRLYTYVEKPQYRAQIVMPGHVLIGVVHLPERANPMFLLSPQSTIASFVAVTDVTVRRSIPSSPRIQMKTVICRRQYIQALHLGDDPRRKPSVTEAVSQLRGEEDGELTRKPEAMKQEPLGESTHQVTPGGSIEKSPCVIPFRSK